MLTNILVHILQGFPSIKIEKSTHVSPTQRGRHSLFLSVRLLSVIFPSSWSKLKVLEQQHNGESFCRGKKKQQNTFKIAEIAYLKK